MADDKKVPAWLRSTPQNPPPMMFGTQLSGPHFMQGLPQPSSLGLPQPLPVGNQQQSPAGLNEANKTVKYAITQLSKAGRLFVTGGQKLEEAGAYLSREDGSLLREAGIAITQAGHGIEKQLPPLMIAYNFLSQGGALMAEAGRGTYRGTLITKAGEKIFSGGRIMVEREGTLDMVDGCRHVHAGGLLLLEAGQFIRKGVVPGDDSGFMGGQGHPLEQGGLQLMRAGQLLQDGAQVMIRGLDLMWKGIEPFSAYTQAHRIPRGPARERVKAVIGMNDPNTLDLYKIIAEIGSGSFAKVYLGQHKVTKERVAIKKVFFKAANGTAALENLRRERRTFQELFHHHIVYWISCFPDGETAIFIMEFLPMGTLLSQITRDGGFTIDVVRFYSGELIMALQYIRSMKWVHRDVKPANILLTAKLHIKLADFGLAKKIDDVNKCCVTNREAAHLHKSSTFSGSLCYMAPEVVKHDFYATTFSSDVYSLGANIYTMVTNKPPFNPTINKSRTKEDLKNEVRSGAYYRLPESVDKQLVHLYEHLMSNLSAIASSGWLSSDSDSDDALEATGHYIGQPQAGTDHQSDTPGQGRVMFSIGDDVIDLSGRQSSSTVRPGTSSGSSMSRQPVSSEPGQHVRDWLNEPQRVLSPPPGQHGEVEPPEETEDITEVDPISVCPEHGM